MSSTDVPTYKHLRMTKSSVLREYMENTMLLQELGNTEFGKRMREGNLGSGEEKSKEEALNSPYVLSHSWMLGIRGLNEKAAAIVRDLMGGMPESSFTDAHRKLSNTLIEMGWCADVPIDLDSLIKKTQMRIIAIQNAYEQKAFLKILQEKRPKVIVEIGTARGGMLYCFSQLAAPDALLVSIDLPGAPNCGGQTENEREFYSTFGPPAQTFQFIPMSSFHHTAREALREILDGRKVDLLFIDGDHSYGGVRSDFGMYKEFAAPDGLIVFHDICTLPEHWGPDGEVGVYWQEIKEQYETREIIDPDGKITRDIEPGELRAWGIGIVGKQKN